MAEQNSSREGVIPGVVVPRSLGQAAAIVPTYNEGERIIPVLQALSTCPLVGEILVVDDGSDVSMAWVTERFPAVRFFRHEHNRGKAVALETGVQGTDAEFLFFCDADLIGLKPEYVSELINAVLSGEHEMSIGLRDNPAQRAVYLFALNSGERCIKKSDWIKLSTFYKRGFRIETGLNIAQWRKRKKIFRRQYAYTQTVREKKYGLLIGFRSRLRMSYDVVCAWGFALLSGR